MNLEILLLQEWTILKLWNRFPYRNVMIMNLGIVQKYHRCVEFIQSVQESQIKFYMINSYVQNQSES